MYILVMALKISSRDIEIKRIKPAVVMTGHVERMIIAFESLSEMHRKLNQIFSYYNPVSISFLACFLSKLKQFMHIVKQQIQDRHVSQAQIAKRQLVYTSL